MVNSAAKDKRDHTYRKVYNETHSLKELIDPNEVTPEATSWDEIEQEDLERHIHDSIEVKMGEGHFSGDIEQLAVIEWVSDMPRVKLDDLVFDTVKEALENGYRPYETGNMGATYRIHEMVDEGRVEVPHTARNRARSLVKSAIADKLNPNIKEPQR
jgi:hypothetical protein